MFSGSSRTVGVGDSEGPTSHQNVGGSKREHDCVEARINVLIWTRQNPYSNDIYYLNSHANGRRGLIPSQS